MSEKAEGVAIVGMAGRFPGANNVDHFWKNIKAGVESITHFSPGELEVDRPDESDGAAKYVCAKGMLDDIDMFDASFFGYLPREAEVMDPQHRIFLEICWEAMEHAGYDASRYPGAVGVYGGCYMDTYVLNNLCSDDAFRRKLVESIQVGTLQTELGNDKDYLATRVAFKMGLRGPAMTLQTACSTSLVAIATACQSIESYQCDMALAGGVTIVLPQMKGYHYKEGGMLSPDGHCRPFSDNAEGTVFSNGAAVLLLKRAEDAIRDGDTIYAIIRGYATNNDGGEKLSYTAPSVDGQAEVISLALGMGGIDARSIGYMEAHGTATPLGDPIEVAGLTKAHRTMTDDTQYCVLGSVKANLGHLDCASGAIGLIKTSLALHEKILPPLLHFENPNPKIDFKNSPFYINTELKEWPAGDAPRRAGVSSMGVGGTNAHVVIEEAPPAHNVPSAASSSPSSHELLMLSAKTPTALAQKATDLADFLEAHPQTNLADIAYTLRVGRKEFAHRRTIVAKDMAQAIAQLRSVPRADEAVNVAPGIPEIVFMFPGQGAQYPGMGAALYDEYRVYRDVIDKVAQTLLAEPVYGRDIRNFLLCKEKGEARDQLARELANTANAQPALFAIECALAALVRSWGIKHAAVVGHSIGEFASAVTAGIFSLEDGARLVAARGALMQAQPAGQMLAVMADRDEVARHLRDGLVIAAVNAPGTVVVSGDAPAIASFASMLEAHGIASTILKTSHAFHSPMMEGARDQLVERASEIEHRDGVVPFYSTKTGLALNADGLKGPDYWGEQMMSPVLFCDAVEAAAQSAARSKTPLLFIELGPGQTLTSFTRRTLKGGRAVSALGPVNDPGDDRASILELAGQFWANGVALDWPELTKSARRRIALPTYPFERKRFWIEPASAPVKGGVDIAVQPQTVNITKQKDGNGADSGVDELIDQQLDVIAAQLSLLKGS